VALALELELQIQVVFDDSVVDDDDLARAVAVRVSVFLGRAAVSGPAGVSHAVVAGEGRAADDALEIRELAGAASQSDVTVLHHGDAGRVVAAIFEPPQPVNEDRDDVFRADIADDSAHGRCS